MSEPAPVPPGPSVDWLGKTPPPAAVGLTWGTPWPQGHIQQETLFTLTDSHGVSIPVQSWPLAYWPDGTVKWTGHAVSAAQCQAGPFRLSVGAPALPPVPLQVEQTADAIVVRNGATTYRLPKTGSALIAEVALGDRIVATDGRLVCLREDRSDWATSKITREEEFISRIDAVTVEQSGPVHAVVKIRGRHQAQGGGRSWLPFTVRFYFTAGCDSIRMVHSFVFDGDQETDFIAGLGIRFTVPLREEFHNRHVRLAGDTGLFAEPVRVIAGRRNPDPALYAQQIAGQSIPKLNDLPSRANVEKMAAWSDWKLTQLTADSYTVQKRTGAHSAWINAAGGSRSLGTVFVGDTTGGLALGMTNFWQFAPTGLEIQNAAANSADLTLWLWSPDAPAMDLRHYDIQDHGLEASYEDIEPGFSTAHGIARTTELLLCPFDGVPSNATLMELSQINAAPPHLVCTPEYYHCLSAFGVWSLPDRSTPVKAWIEDQLDVAIAFYQGQIAQRRWYGFWDYGDVMHSYDAARHTWRYDIGGFAWANTELMPDLWLWYSFLRTGRADIFRMAEAMTRHTQEVDVYHLGPLSGLGTRHNVRHWGCGAKEARVSQSLLKRFLYYLTADERMGDLMDEVTNADYRTVEVDPLRKIEPKTHYPTHTRVGPDWFAFCSNWLAVWECTGERRWRDKIVTGMKCLAAMPHKLFSGPSYGYDPRTGELFLLHDCVDIPHLAALMGGPELCMELTPLIDLPEWNEAWLHYCRCLQAPPEEQRRELGVVYSHGRGPHYARMTGWAACQTRDAGLAQRAWREFLRDDFGKALFASQTISGPDVPAPVEEGDQISTNSTAQWCLNAIELLELVPNVDGGDAQRTRDAEA